MRATPSAKTKPISVNVRTSSNDVKPRRAKDRRRGRDGRLVPRIFSSLDKGPPSPVPRDHAAPAGPLAVLKIGLSALRNGNSYARLGTGAPIFGWRKGLRSQRSVAHGQDRSF
jgi:hypothetical protein